MSEWLNVGVRINVPNEELSPMVPKFEKQPLKVHPQIQKDRDRDFNVIANMNRLKASHDNHESDESAKFV